MARNRAVVESRNRATSPNGDNRLRFNQDVGHLKPGCLHVTDCGATRALQVGRPTKTVNPRYTVRGADRSVGAAGVVQPIGVAFGVFRTAKTMANSYAGIASLCVLCALCGKKTMLHETHSPTYVTIIVLKEN